MIEINKRAFDQFVKQHERFDYYKREWAYRDQDTEALNIPVRRFTIEELKDLVKILGSSLPRPTGMIQQIQSHLDVMQNPRKHSVGKLVVLESAITSYLKEGIVEGWIFLKNPDGQQMEPYLVLSVVYHPTEILERGNTIPAHVTMETVRWDGRGSSRNQETKSFQWHASDIGKSVDLILLDENLHHETPELVKEYYKREKVFLEWRKSLGTQFLGNGKKGFSYIDDDRWRDSYDADMNNARLVIDDAGEAIDRHKGTGLFQDQEDEDSPSLDPEAAEKYCRLPLAFYINVFNLDSHRNGYVHIDRIEPYVYRPEIRKNLILPMEHEDLIDALTADMDVLMEDIVSGKGGGTTIICQGPSGTGKTLTAEVYSEVVKRPLYRIHSGQLGIEAAGVEEELKAAMERAKRWGAVMLIDEADVFVMKRGASLELNAVCSVFLRTLEYYDGLCFLTTNRSDEIDDAILSRCIAHIAFGPPMESEREKLWVSLGQVFGLPLVKKAGLPAKLAKAFPKATGRDIKGLIRLAIKYTRQRKRQVTFEDLKRFAPYKGL
jgi:hypothetical protein